MRGRRWRPRPAQPACPAPAGPRTWSAAPTQARAPGRCGLPRANSAGSWAPALILRRARIRWKFVMKAILLAGGKGTRLRPLTIHTPKPVVPIFDRAFLHYQIDLLKQVPEIDEVILSLNYQPRRIEEVFGDGAGTGVRLRYVVEPSPLGTGGAIRYAGQGIDDTLVVFNGDVMTSVDVKAVVALHRERQAKATIVLTPVD